MLQCLFVTSPGELAAFPPSRLELVAGANAAWLSRLAHGIDAEEVRTAPHKRIPWLKVPGLDFGVQNSLPQLSQLAHGIDAEEVCTAPNKRYIW